MIVDKVSIIVPCYNQAIFLDAALQSVFCQTYSNWECIIVNDGSSDHTELVALNWVRKDIRFHYLSKLNGGLSSARNYGIKHSTGKYVLPLDADDILDSTYIYKAMRVINFEVDVSVVSCFTYQFEEKPENVIKISKPNGHIVNDILFENKIMATSLYRKESWRTVGGYDENMKLGFEDWEFWLSILKDNSKFKIIEEPLFYYRKKRESMLVSTNRYHKEDIMRYIFSKHKDLYMDNYEDLVSFLIEEVKLERNFKMALKSSLNYKLGSKILWFLNKVGILLNKENVNCSNKK